MAKPDLLALLERHVELFNEAVSSGNFHPFLATFADTAVMSFDDLPVAPARGIAEIAHAYQATPPLDTIALIDMQEVGADAVEAAFEWDEGGTGSMFLRWDGEHVVELGMRFSA